MDRGSCCSPNTGASSSEERLPRTSHEPTRVPHRVPPLARRALRGRRRRGRAPTLPARESRTWTKLVE
eukprot:249591-Prymnesium_polylepis.1